MGKQFKELFNKIMNETSDLNIELPNLGSINVFESLKRIERTGKKVRLCKLNNDKIVVRKIYDHINSLGVNIEIFYNYNVIDVDKEKLAVLTVYHDLCESVIGDFPSFTSFYKPDSETTFNVQEVDNYRRENIANNLLWLYANKIQKNYFELLKNIDENTRYTFKVLDTIDPLINVYRYMYKYRSELKNNEESFVDAMNDFFTNPILDTLIKEDKYPLISKILVVLKDKDNALAYLKGKSLSEICDSETYNLIKELVEEREIFY